MATPTYTITNASISLPAFDANDTITIQYTINNTSSQTMMWHHVRLETPDHVIASNGNINTPTFETQISPGQSASFTLTLNLEEAVPLENINAIFDGTVRTASVKLGFWSYFSNPGVYKAGFSDTLSSVMLNCRYAPRINQISAYRCDPQGHRLDDGDLVRLLAYSSPVTHGLGKRTLPGPAIVYSECAKVYYAQGRPATLSDPYITLQNFATYFYEVISTSVTFNVGNDYNLLLFVGDQYDYDTKSVDIFKVFANVHLSGTGAGVALGKFSASTVGNPLFECEYPTEFSDDVDVGGDLTVSGKASITGNTSFGGNVAVGAGKLLKVVSITVAISIAADDTHATATKTAAQVQSAIGTGWTALGVVSTYTASWLWYPYDSRLVSSGGLQISVSRRDNAATSATTLNAQMNVLCIRTSL